MPGIVIAGTHSGCGKTTLSLGLMAALRAKGLKVQPFKVGPDFIDTGLHRVATGLPSRNLDLWMCGREYVKRCFARHSSEADISVVEGVMGLYDGENSTYKVASLLGLPIILVVDAYGMAESTAAIVRGFLQYDTEQLIKGVLFNRVGSERHLYRIMNVLKGTEGLGHMPRHTDIEIPSRHLGLLVAEEGAISNKSLHRLAELVLKNIDIDRIIRLAYQSRPTTEINHPLTPKASISRLALAYDEAFCFYYEDNLDLFREAGTEIVRFSPLTDKEIPPSDMVYIGGGYPELYAEALSNNTEMLMALKKWCDDGMPLYAECGGMMYMSKGITDLKGRRYPMAGVFDLETKMRDRLHRLGYREVELLKDCVLGKAGQRLRGHEFHYSEISRIGKVENIYNVTNNEGNRVDALGLQYKGTLASYVHLHFGSCRD